MRGLAEPRRQRRLAYVASVLGITLTVVSVLSEGDPQSTIWLALVVIAVSLGVGVLSRPWRPLAFGVGGGILAMACLDNYVYLVPAVAALVFLSLDSDPAEPPWIGWAAGGLGAVASLLVFPQDATAAPFIAVLLGGGLAILIRSRSRNVELTRSAAVLRAERAWLEQRTVLARELHDVVGHQVTAMVVTAEAGQVGDAPTALRTIAELGRTALGELDGLVVHLRDPAAPLSVSAPPRLLDIDELLAEPLRRQGVTVAVRAEPDLGLDDADVLTVYRIAQEALTNVARHARARRVWVELGRDAAVLRLRVSDDGVGVSGIPRRGSGLLGIDERVTARGGVWALEERPGGGTMVSVVLPQRG